MLAADLRRGENQEGSRALGATGCEKLVAASLLLFELQLRDAELTFELVELAHVDRAHDVDDRELARLAGDDGEAVDALLIDEHVNVHVLLLFAAANLDQ